MKKKILLHNKKDNTIAWIDVDDIVYFKNHIAYVNSKSTGYKVINNFIEVTDVDNHEHLINMNCIQKVTHNIIFLNTINSNDEQDYIICHENYNKIKELIEQAQTTKLKRSKSKRSKSTWLY